MHEIVNLILKIFNNFNKIIPGIILKISSLNRKHNKSLWRAVFKLNVLSLKGISLLQLSLLTFL